MRKVVAGTMVAAALAWAHGVRAEDAKTDQKKAQERQTQQGSSSAATEPGRETGIGGTDRTSREMRTDARADQNARSADVKHPLFDGKKNFDLDGKVQEASGDRVTIQRKELPAATLHVAPGTKVVVDGKASSADQLQVGQDVKASFNLRGGTPEAVEIKADKLKKDDRKEMGEQRRENVKDMNERANERAREQQGK